MQNVSLSPVPSKPVQDFLLLDTSDLDLVDDILAGGNTESEAETPKEHAEHHFEEQQEVSISDSCLKKCVSVSSEEWSLEFVGPPANSDVRDSSPKTFGGGKSDQKKLAKEAMGFAALQESMQVAMASSDVPDATKKASFNAASVGAGKSDQKKW